jgi:superfamily II DNA or RNA helicase
MMVLFFESCLKTAIERKFRMSFQLTERIIKLLCGSDSFEQGQHDYRRGKVTLSGYLPNASSFEAKVEDNGVYQVSVHIDSNGDVDAHCSCPHSYSTNHYCKHIAAVLLHIHDRTHSGSAPVRSHAMELEDKPALLHPGGQLTPRFHSRSPSTAQDRDARLMKSVLDLFSEKPLQPSGSRSLFESRELLEVQFTCRPVSFGYRKFMMGVELKLGPKRLYIVQRIREFLEHVKSRKAYSFSKHFTYDPSLHCFGQKEDAVLQLLIQIHHNERLYQESRGSSYALSSRSSDDRLLLIPPASWEDMIPALTDAANVVVEHGRAAYAGLELSEAALPLQYRFDQSGPDSFQMEAEGLENITVLEPYGYALAEGRLVKLGPALGKKLHELKLLLEDSTEGRLHIPAVQMEPFMERVVPGLMKLGNVRIAQAVSEQIVQTKLTAKLYLDRVRDRLLAALEFHYGGIIVNPLEDTQQHSRTDRILVRDGVRERAILELMEQTPFVRTESGFILGEEEAEYHFLYHVVPQLEKHLQVFATTAVRNKLHSANVQPKVKADVDERTNWLEFRFSMDGIPESEIRKVLKSLEEKRSYHRLPNGSFLPLESEEFLEIMRFVHDVGIHPGEMKEPYFRLPASRALHLADAGMQGKSVKLGKPLRQLIDHLRHPDSLEFPVPEALEPIMRDYQKYGLQWMRTLAHYRFGGILADDMGLGKTLQGISFILSMLQEIREHRQPALIISPASLIYNWLNELKKFTPGLKAVIVDGSKEERRNIVQAASTGDTDILITSYPLLRRDMELYAGTEFHTLLLDEAQMFKNHATQTAQSVKIIQARYRFALTGTPVENRLEELWSIFDAVFPSLFTGRRAFNELSRETVAKRVRPFLLRRLKSDVLKELPEKIESIQASQLLPEQKKLYGAYLAKLREETLEHLDKDTFEKNRIKILAGLTRLRQLCCHPALFVEDYKGSSAKLEQLLELIEECRSAGKRMLVFSQFTEMLGLIGRELVQQEIPYFYLDGSTPVPSRVELCNRFNNGERELFLISLKAGGTGLNLTGADTVILYDLWWNPAVEEQAADRAHRIGQQNVVQVIRLVAQGTVEDKMYELQKRKRSMIEEIIQPGHEGLSALTEQEIRELLTED